VRRERFDFLRWFDGTVVSSEEGIVKPDPRIFVLLLERYGLQAASTLLIDDSARNIAAAEALGMPTIHFQSPEALRRALETAGVLNGGHSTKR
jgi:2-haloacid dehalogenase